MALLLLTPAVGTGQHEELASFEGEYSFAGGEQEEARLEGAIDEVVDDMNPLVRGIARSQIADNIDAEERVQLRALDGGRVQLTLDEWSSPPIPVGGQSVRGTGPDGRPLTLSASLDGERLKIVQRSDRGTRESWFTRAPDGEHLFMQVRIGSDQLPTAIRYTLTYRAVA